MFGLHAEQIEEAGRISRIFGEEWKGLVAGREGYLLNKGQEGTVRWGEMVCGESENLGKSGSIISRRLRFNDQSIGGSLLT